jgi:hypothetical protein
MDALQASVSDLGNVDVSAQGLATLQDDLAAVGTDVQQVVDDAKAQYATNADQLDADYAAVRSAAKSAQAAPTAATLGAVRSSISTLTDDVRVFADDIAATC